MNRIPIITGLGLVTPLGTGVDETWRALLAGRFITTHARCPLDSTSPDRVHALAIAAAREALLDASWESRPVPGPECRGVARGRAGSPSDVAGSTALVVGTSKGAIEAWTIAPPEESFLASLAVAVRARCPLLDGPSLTLSAACASGLHALIRGAMMIRGGEADRVLVVAAEASVSPLFLASFRRLGVLPAEGVGCRPFDVERDGFLMSEAAAAVCLESAESASRGYARIDRFALGGDAGHLTSGDPGGLVLRRLLKDVVAARPVDLIHAHGTGTVFNDPIELTAFEAECVYDGRTPLVYSHKGALGHSLGASGLVSTALSCVMHRRGTVPPNARTRNPLPTRGVHIGADAVKTQPIRRSVVAAAGFGGAIAAISLNSF